MELQVKGDVLDGVIAGFKDNYAVDEHGPLAEAMKAMCRGLDHGAFACACTCARTCSNASPRAQPSHRQDADRKSVV